MDRIVIAGLRELGVHGVLAEEQTRPQPFEVDVELSVDASRAGESDALEHTVDYSAVAESVSRVVRSERASEGRVVRSERVSEGRDVRSERASAGRVVVRSGRARPVGS